MTDSANIRALLNDLLAAGVELRPHAGQLTLKGPQSVLTPTVLATIKSNKANIINMLETDVETVPLSSGQQALWFEHQLMPESAAYHVSFAVQIYSPVQANTLRRAFQLLVNRHPALRTTFILIDDVPVQQIHLYQPAAFRQVEAKGWSQDELQIQVKQSHQQLFDLSHGPICRATLFTEADDRHVLLFSAHHLVCDGVSLGVIVDELVQLYEFLQAPNPTPLNLPFAHLSYAKCLTKQANQLASEAERLWAFWERKLHFEGDDLPTLNLPTDYTRPVTWTPVGQSHPVTLSSELTQQLRDLARQENVTLYMLLLAAYQVLLHRYSNQTDIWVASPMAGRTGIEDEPVVGYFVSPVVLPARFTDQLTFKAFLQQIRQTTTEALAHQAYPFAQLVERLQPERDVSRPRLTQAAFALQKLHRADLFSPHPSPDHIVDWGPFSVSPLPIGTLEGMYEIQLELLENDDFLAGSFKYNSTLFSEGTIKRLATHYEILLRDILRDASQPIADLSLLTEAERQQILVTWNDTQTNFPQDQALHQRIEAQVARTPEATALIFVDPTAGEASLSYAELNAQANQLAHLLQSQGVGPGVLVGLYIERSPEMLVSVLAVLKAGGAYVPLDPTFPVERIAFMLADCQAVVLLTQAKLLEALPNHTAHVICVDANDDSITSQPETNLTPITQPEDLAYVIYTSGSTGQPKGVQIPHRAVVNFLSSMQHEPGLTGDDILLAVTTLSFDIAALELYLPLMVGGRIILTSTQVTADGQQLQHLLTRHQVTVMQATPAMWRLLLTSGWQGTPGLKMLCGGEALPRELAERLLDCGDSLWNMYGPTETTIWSAVQQVTQAEIEGTGDVAIGRPIANTQLYIVDKQQQPVPIGVQGELLIGGTGVGHGYLNRPSLAAEKFIPNPFAASTTDTTASPIVYRTGDLARYRPDGTVEFLGRIDYQVKVRGFRIELGEIEAALTKQPHVAQAVVIARPDQSGENRLVAYIVADAEMPKSDDSLSPTTLRQALQSTLPAYMIPASFVTLDRLPLTPNGKIDRKALPEPTARPEILATYHSPQSELERRLATIWQTVLGVERVGIQDNFFELGGHSLLLVTIHSQLLNLIDDLSLQQPVTLIDLLRYPTIQSLAQYLTIPSDTPALLSPQAPPTKDDAIAIIGLAGRFPGAESVDAFWQNLCDGKESITFFTDAELQAAGVELALLSHPNYVKAAGILKDIEQFDADFFGFSAREAQLLDPQLRLFMTCAWEALEQANCIPAHFSGKIGVYAGAGMNGYLHHHLTPHLESTDPAATYQAMISNDKDFLATRLSYKLNLNGPSVSVQTACSTSLVAVHLAAQALQRGECDVALVGAAAIQVPHKRGYLHQPGMILSPDGHCRPFAANAAGTVTGSGVGVVALKRFSDAMAEGDVIHAVIKGSAINNDGAMKVGYTAPSVEGQIEVISQALHNAGISPETIGYIESHGTGTKLGDPIEVMALMEAFQAHTSKQNVCVLGAVKSNIGHLDTAAGMAGLIKAVMALKHNVIPPTLHFTTPNPELKLTDSPFTINTELKRWDIEAGVRRAGVSSFGIGGTNAHIILEEANSPSPPSFARRERGLGGEGLPASKQNILTLSAKTPKALTELAARYHAHLAEQPDLSLPDVCHTTQLGRSHFKHRLAIVASSIDEVQEKLAQFNAKESKLQFGLLNNEPAIAFLFTGQGSQYITMGRGLFETQPVFREAIEQCDAILQPHLGQSLLDILYPTTADETSTELITQTQFTQPALFAVEYALAQLWQAWGVTLNVVLGHSVGEIVAACVAGVFSLADGLKLIAARGRLMQARPQNGSMAVVLASEAIVKQAIAEYPKDVSIAALNGPRNVVISGQQEAIDDIITSLTTQDIQTHSLDVSHAFHSPLMEPMLAEFEEVLNGIQFRPPNIPLISNVTGKLATEAIATPEYWLQHIRQPVRFADSIETLTQTGCNIALEVGPKPTLLSMAQQVIGEAQGPRLWLPSLRRRQNDTQQMLDSLAQLYMQGAKINWAGFAAPFQSRFVTLPPYPFQPKRYWIEPPQAKPQSQASEPRLRPLVDRMIHLQQQEQLIFETEFSLATLPTLAEHKLYDRVVSPGAYHLALVLNAIDLSFEQPQIQLDDIIFPEALVIPEDGARLAQLVLTPTPPHRHQFRLTSVVETVSADTPTLHVTGYVTMVTDLTPAKISLAECQKQCQQALDVDRLYEQTAGRVLHGPNFRWVQQLWRGEAEYADTALAKLHLPAAVATMQGYQLHPGLLDACFQTAGLVFSDETDQLMLPFAVESLRLHQVPVGREWWCTVQRVGEQKWNLQLLDEVGQCLVELVGFQRRAAAEKRITKADQDWQQWLYEIDWEPQPPSRNHHQDETANRWLIFADEAGQGEALAQILARHGQAPVLVYTGEAYEAKSSLAIPIYHIRPNEADDYERLLTEVEPVNGIVHLWSLDISEAQGETAASTALTDAQRGCGTMLHLVQALYQQAWTSPRLWLVTRNTQAVLQTDRLAGIAQAPLWGMGKVLSQEHPELRCVCLDLDETSKMSDLAIELNLMTTPIEPQIALRQGQRYVARLARFKPNPTASSQVIRDDGAYLITGGLGGLGLTVAQWLARQGAGQIILLGRHGPTPEVQAQLEVITESGARLTVAPADVTDGEKLAEVFATLDSAYPLRGIIHAAGILDDGAIFRQSWPRFEQVLAPKLQGTWHLDRLSEGQPLDFFVMFASGSGLLGNPGQANYVAANVFMDAFAYHRRGRGLPALSIDWGTWSSVGMAAEFAEREQTQLQASGHTTITPDQGAEMLGRLLAQTLTDDSVNQVGVMMIDWAKYLGTFAEPPAFLQNLESRSKRQPQTAQPQVTSSPTQTWQSLPMQERREQVMVYLQNEVQQALLMDQVPDMEQGFVELGLDSLMALSLKSRLETGLNVSLPATLLFEYPNISTLTDFLIDALESSDTPPKDKSDKKEFTKIPKSDPKDTDETTDIDQMSVEDLIDLISKEYDEHK